MPTPAGLFGTLSLCGGLVCYTAAVFLAGGSAGTLLHFVLFLLAFVVCIEGSGLHILRLLAPWFDPVDALITAFLPGCALTFAGYALVWGLGALLPFLRTGMVFALLPAWLFGGLEWAHLYHRRTDLCADLKNALSRGATPCALVAATLGPTLAVTAVWGVLPAAGTGCLRAWAYNQDQLWSVGNAAAVQFGLPLQDMRVAGATLHYHFLNDVTAGLLALGTGGSAWAGLCWFWNLPVLTLAVVGLYRAGRRMVPGCEWLAALVPFAVVFCSASDSTLPTNLFTNANAQATALAAFCAGVLLLFNLPQPGKKAAHHTLAAWLLLCCVSAAAFTLLKSTVGLLLVLALGAALVVGAVFHRAHAVHLVTFAGLLVGFLAVYLCVLRFATNNLVFTSFASLAQLPNAYRTHFSLPLLLLYLAGLAFSAVQLPKLQIPQLTLNAFSIGGMLAVVLYSHYSASQVYFALTAFPCALLTLLPAACALAQRLSGAPRIGRRAAALLLAAALCLGGGAELYAGRSYLRTGAQAALRCLGRPSFEPAETTMTDGDWAAALWLRDNTATDTIFATNRNNKSFDAAEGTFHFYTAASQRRCYLESYRYGMDYDGAYHEIRRRLEQVSDAMFYRLPEAEAFALAKEEGIDYLMVSLLVPDAPVWGASPVYENEFTRIYAVM